MMRSVKTVSHALRLQGKKAAPELCTSLSESNFHPGSAGHAIPEGDARPCLRCLVGDNATARRTNAQIHVV